jgi:hypothetical protein
MAVRTAVACLVLIGTLSLLAAEAAACSCPLPPPPAEALAQSAVVFEGHPLANRDSGAEDRTVTLVVLRAWKGATAGDRIEVRTANASSACGVPFELGTPHLVYATHEADALVTTLCSRSRPTSSAAADVAALGPPTSMIAGGTALPPSADAAAASDADAAGFRAEPATPQPHAPADSEGTSSAHGCVFTGRTRPYPPGAALLAVAAAGMLVRVRRASTRRSADRIRRQATD